MQKMTVGIAFLFVALLVGVESSKILVVFHFNSKSHFVMAEALAKGLAARGHEVTVVSHFPQETPIPNYRDISLKGTAEGIVNNMTVERIFREWRDIPSVMDFIWRVAGVELCQRMLETSAIQQLLQSKEKFDILITELWASDCFLPLANVFRVPHISLLTTMEVPWALDRYGNPLNPSYQVNHFTTYSTSGMSFWQRVFNTVFTAYLKIGYHLNSEVPTNEVLRKYLPQPVPHLSEIVKQSSALFINTHSSLTGGRPLVPTIIEVGGLHIGDPKPIPLDLKTFLDEAEEGVILFSLGSIIRAETMDESAINAFVDVFRHLPLKVLWKFNGTVNNQPSNLKTVSWIPQSDILRHKNVRLFITHGGLMGTQEAISAGVPMLGVPFFADQRFNVRNYEEKGFALSLEVEDITRDAVRDRVTELLTNPRYREAAERYSRLFLDRPQSALATAVYWTEYVIRHNGTEHLRSAAVNLTYAQYHLMDVQLFFLVVASAVAYAVYAALSKFGRAATRGRQLDRKAKRS